jgi:hypothetical protein
MVLFLRFSTVHIKCLEQWLLARPERRGQSVDLLQCELCSSNISAKISLAPFTTMLWDQGGRSIIIMFCLRLAYRLYLLRRLLRRYANTAKKFVPWPLKSKADPVKSKSMLDRLSTGFDLVFFALIGSLSTVLLVRDIRAFYRSTNTFRRARATIRVCSAGNTPSTNFLAST